MNTNARALIRNILFILLILCVLFFTISEFSGAVANNIGMIFFAKYKLTEKIENNWIQNVDHKLNNARKIMQLGLLVNESSNRLNLDLARVNLETDQIESTIKTLENQLTNPENFRLSGYLLGQYYADSGDFQRSASAWSQIGASNQLYMLALDYEAKGEDSIALFLLEEAVRTNGMISNAWIDLGVMRFKVLGDKINALSALSQAVTLNPNIASPLCEIAMVYYESADYENSIKTSEMIISQFTQEPCGWRFLSGSWNRLGQHEKAENALKSGITELPTFASLHDDLANLYLGQGRLDEAIEEFETAVSLAPNTWWYIKHLGEAYYLAGEKNEALIFFKEALQLHPESVELQSLVTIKEKEINQK